MKEPLLLPRKKSSKLSREHLINYYATISKVMLPYLINRPQSISSVPVGSKKVKSEGYLICNDIATLLNLAQQGHVEMSPCSATVSTPDHPDWISIGLKPEDIAFKEVVKAALQTKKQLDAFNVKSYCKTCGGAGLQIYIPLSGAHTYNTARKFAEYIALEVNSKLPSTTSVLKQSSKRRKKVYLDLEQNAPGETLVAPYSLNTDTTVSTPLEWKEVNDQLTPGKFTISTVLKRIGKKGDLWKPLLAEGANLHNVLYQLVMYH